MSKPRSRPRKSTKKRGAFKMTPSKIKAQREISASVREKMYGPEYSSEIDEEFLRL